MVQKCGEKQPHVTPGCIKLKIRGYKYNGINMDQLPTYIIGGNQDFWLPSTSINNSITHKPRIDQLTLDSLPWRCCTIWPLPWVWRRLPTDRIRHSDCVCPRRLATRKPVSRAPCGTKFAWRPCNVGTSIDALGLIASAQ